ncbi:TetR/AcrR family transcriptional regulator [Geobacillus sp. WSUCF1]|uniref:TetR/AcrR family transcriptional regulator n=1 Tax=Geobacillus sp. WSUCF1 TaxID=886559 RepID=UPI0003588323|nr:helix-turn-helix domain-containing protein [Geobacillus sp. WSUCF1]EPR27741.1 Transcriptional regulator, TetR family protein [Geobacillus sp. WSUCF1]
MNGFARRTEQKKQAIKQAVLELLQKIRDPREVTIQEIAKQAHVSPVTIYNYFGSKENLIRETLLDDVVRQVMNTRRF